LSWLMHKLSTEPDKKCYAQNNQDTNGSCVEESWTFLNCKSNISASNKHYTLAWRYYDVNEMHYSKIILLGHYPAYADIYWIKYIYCLWFISHVSLNTPFQCNTLIWMLRQRILVNDTKECSAWWSGLWLLWSINNWTMTFYEMLRLLLSSLPVHFK